jgi:hypothetical protein
VVVAGRDRARACDADVPARTQPRPPSPQRAAVRAGGPRPGRGRRGLGEKSPPSHTSHPNPSSQYPSLPPAHTPARPAHLDDDHGLAVHLCVAALVAGQAAALHLARDGLADHVGLGLLGLVRLRMKGARARGFGRVENSEREWIWEVAGGERFGAAARAGSRRGRKKKPAPPPSIPHLPCPTTRTRTHAQLTLPASPSPFILWTLTTTTASPASSAAPPLWPARRRPLPSMPL